MKIVTNQPYPNRIQWILENYTGPFSQQGPLGAFDPRRDLEVYVDGVLIPVRSFVFDSANNRYLLYMSQNINLQGVVQVIHHMPNPPFSFGLAEPPAPTFSPVAGTYNSSQSVTISDAAPGVVIYYTTDGSTPTPFSAVFSTPITVSANETIKAIATVNGGYVQSAVASAAYVITPPAATPTFSPVAGTYATTQSVTISDTTPGAVIHYTTDGSTPTTGSPVYSTAISVATTTTVKAIAVASGYSESSVGSALYTITPPASGFGESFGTAFGS